MLNQHLDSAAIEKLQKLIKNRFGKLMKLRALTDIHNQEATKELRLLGEDLHIPLQQNDQFLGTVIIPEASDLKSESQQQISQMIRMVMEPTLYSWFLERKENNLKQISTFSFSTENLDVFEDLLQDEASSFQEDDEVHVIGEDQSQLISSLIHLSGKTDSMNRKVALQIHDMAHRWAFVPIQDMASSITDVNDLRKLGALTLYIPEVESLDPQLQKVIVDYLNQVQGPNEPLIITSSMKTTQEIGQCESLVPQLRSQALSNSFEVDQAPLSYQNLKEVLEMFFFKTPST